MVKLVRWKQAEWELNKNVFEMDDFIKYGEDIWAPVLEKVLRSDNGNVNVREEMEKAIKAHPEAVKNEAEKKEEEEGEEAKKEEKSNTAERSGEPPLKKTKTDT